MDFSALNRLLPPPLTNPFFRTPGQAADAVIAPIQQMTGIPGSYQFIEQGIQRLLSPRGIQQRSVVNPEFMRPNYSGAGERARRFQEYKTGRDIPGANTDYSARLASGAAASDPASERAYQAEKARVAQLTAQDPELQRYERARQTAVAPGATPEQVQSAEDIGMAIWARSNPTLAAKVKPGQSGYDVIQGTLAGQAAAQGYGYQMPQQIMMTPPPGVNAPQGLPAVQSISPTATYGAQGLEVDPEMAKKFQALLNQKKS